MRLSGPTGEEYRIIQIHPTLRCNLRCLHCYSTSGPKHQDQLTTQQLKQCLSDLHAEGYNCVGVSGGEPLIFQPLAEVLRHARDLGMITTVTTNAMLLTPRLVEQFGPVVDLLAISLDGKVESHNEMRNNSKAFDAMARRVELLPPAGIRFGFIFTLTLYNLDELDWVTDFAVERGASLLQIHPLEEFGRASETLHRAAPDDYELARAFVEIAQLQEKYRGVMRIQFDAADRELLRADPTRAYAVDTSVFDGQLLEETPLADLLAPIVVEADGSVVPIQYGFSHQYKIGDITLAAFREQMKRWKAKTYPAFLQLCREVYSEMMSEDYSPYPFVNWYGAISANSRASQVA